MIEMYQFRRSTIDRENYEKYRKYITSLQKIMLQYILEMFAIKLWLQLCYTHKFVLKFSRNVE